MKSHGVLKVAQPYMMGGVAALLFSCSAFAHPGHGLSGFVSGFAHPMTGIDHILCALAVGILAVNKNRKINYEIPMVFIIAMICGILIGRSGIAIPFYEQGITLSLILLGICVVFGSRLNSLSSLALVACFGVLHGNAHGIEVDNGSLSFSAIFGLLFATSILLTIGTGLALIIRKSLADERATWAMNILGAIIVGSAFILK